MCVTGSAAGRSLPPGSRPARSPATTTTRRRVGTGTCCPRSDRGSARGAPRSRGRRAGPTRGRRTTTRGRPGCPRAPSPAGRRGGSGPRGRRRGGPRGSAPPQPELTIAISTLTHLIRSTKTYTTSTTPTRHQASLPRPRTSRAAPPSSRSPSPLYRSAASRPTTCPRHNRQHH